MFPFFLDSEAVSGAEISLITNQMPIMKHSIFCSSFPSFGSTILRKPVLHKENDKNIYEIG